MPYLEPHRVDLIELDELRYAAELLHAFTEQANPAVVGERVINAARDELAIIYSQIEPYQFLPF
jgi:hypothetical protein